MHGGHDTLISLIIVLVAAPANVTPFGRPEPALMPRFILGWKRLTAVVYNSCVALSTQCFKIYPGIFFINVLCLFLLKPESVSVGHVILQSIILFLERLHT